MLRSFSKTPLQLPREELNILKSLQPILHRLYDSIALDKHFIVNAFKPMTAECEWIKQEIVVYERCHRAQELKPRLSLPNFVYMARDVCAEDEDEDSKMEDVEEGKVENKEEESNGDIKMQE